MFEPYETAKKILVAARRKIAKPENWCKGEWAVNRYGVEIDAIVYPALAGDAYCSFCLTAAVMSASVNYNDNARLFAKQKLRDQLFGNFHSSLVKFNDHQTTEHSDVIGCLDRAIESLSQEIDRFRAVAIKQQAH